MLPFVRLTTFVRCRLLLASKTLPDCRRLTSKFDGAFNTAGVAAISSSFIFLILPVRQTDFVFERICSGQTGRCGHEVGYCEHEVEDGRANFLIDIIRAHASAKEREVDKHQDFLQAGVILKEKFAEWQVGKHNRVCVAGQLVEL